jgi:hypothetical protein
MVVVPVPLMVPPDQVEAALTTKLPLPVSVPPVRVSPATVLSAERLQVPELITAVSFAVGTSGGFQLPGVDQSCDTDPVQTLFCWAMDSVTLTANIPKNKTTIIEFFLMGHLVAFQVRELSWNRFSWLNYLASDIPGVPMHAFKMNSGPQNHGSTGRIPKSRAAIAVGTVLRYPAEFIALCCFRSGRRNRVG